MDTGGSGVRPDLDDNEAGAAFIRAWNIGGIRRARSGSTSEFLVVRNVEALDAGGSLFKRGGGSGAGDAEGDDDGDCRELHNVDQ
jgi:hypothetical protein